MKPKTRIEQSSESGKVWDIERIPMQENWEDEERITGI
jgi:hypothetical protein